VVQQAGLGAGFDILVDGKARTFRDLKQTAIEAGIVFKRERPQSEVTVRDVRDNSVTVIDGEFVAAFEISRKR
jgi:FMN-dependent NADH-azoreductase